ncbi:MAG: histidine kinase [Lachnospiraceae bacterium]|nr:histidine kinase [Lachnospiraceae bacterium]
MYRVNIYLEVFGFLTLLIVLIGVQQETIYDSKHSRFFLGMLIANMCMQITDAISWYNIGHYNEIGPVADTVISAMLVSNFVAYYTILVLFAFYTVSYAAKRTGISIRRAYFTLPFCIPSAIGWIISAFNGMFVGIKDGKQIIGPYYMWGQVGGFVCVLLFIYLLIYCRKYLDGRDIVALSSFIFFPMVGVVARMFIDYLSVMPPAITLSLFLMYVFIHVEQAKRLKEQEVRMTEDRIRIMMSQIRPHFIFNTLNSIYILCEKDPAEAQRAVGDFAEYLRSNLEGLESATEVTMTKELDYIKHYLRLEKMRFQEELEMEFDIEVEDFTVPALSIQPIVENAVKHGIAKKKNGGTITLMTRDKGDHVDIIVKDDGVGFDPKVPKNDGKIHVGMSNVRERLWNISHATMDVESAPGNGTCVTIHIPNDQRLKLNETKGD